VLQVDGYTGCTIGGLVASCILESSGLRPLFTVR
jgi:hypothetical protein